jgi:hypothetical protein
MTDGNGTVRLHAHLHAGPDDDPETIEQDTITIRRDWSELGTIEPAPTTPVPDDARGVDIATLGAIVASIQLDALVSALDLLMRWLRNRRGRAVEVVRPDGARIKLSQATAEEQAALVLDFLNQRKTA